MGPDYASIAGTFPLIAYGFTRVDSAFIMESILLHVCVHVWLCAARVGYCTCLTSHLPPATSHLPQPPRTFPTEAAIKELAAKEEEEAAEDGTSPHRAPPMALQGRRDSALLSVKMTDERASTLFKQRQELTLGSTGSIEDNYGEVEPAIDVFVSHAKVRTVLRDTTHSW